MMAEETALEDSPVDTLLLFLDLLRLDFLAPLLVGELALRVHLLVCMLAHRDFAPDTSFDASGVLYRIRREDLHEVGQTDCVVT